MAEESPLVTEGVFFMEKNKKYIILSEKDSKALEEDVNKYLSSTIINRKGDKVPMYELHGSPLVFQHELVQVLSINEEIGEE